MYVVGFEFMTTFWEDFSIADHFGISAIEDTYNRAYAEWKSDYKYLTELVIVLNWKIWQHYETHEELARVYDKLWREADEYACTHLEGDELAYFYEMTD